MDKVMNICNSSSWQVESEFKAVLGYPRQPCLNSPLSTIKKREKGGKKQTKKGAGRCVSLYNGIIYKAKLHAKCLTYQTSKPCLACWTHAESVCLPQNHPTESLVHHKVLITLHSTKKTRKTAAAPPAPPDILLLQPLKCWDYRYAPPT